MNPKSISDTVEGPSAMRDVIIRGGFHLHQAEKPTGQRIPPVEIEAAAIEQHHRQGPRSDHLVQVSLGG